MREGHAGRVVPGSPVSSLWERNEEENGTEDRDVPLYPLNLSLTVAGIRGFHLLSFVSVVLRADIVPDSDKFGTSRQRSMLQVGTYNIKESGLRELRMTSDRAERKIRIITPVKLKFCKEIL